VLPKKQPRRKESAINSRLPGGIVSRSYLKNVCVGRIVSHESSLQAGRVCGPYRRAMGSAGASDPRASAAHGRAGQALARSQGRPKRHPLGLAHRRPWHDLPERYPPYQTCHRRFQRWTEEGVLEEVLQASAEDLKERGGLDLSDPLDAALRERGVEMIAPHRRNRKKPKTQDRRKLRRYKRRWKIERLFAWLGNFRRLVVRYERRAENHLGFVQLGCIVILLRYL
jgi:transposase